MDNFLIDIEYDSDCGVYKANFANGEVVLLGANTYHDAVLEADLLTELDLATA